MDRNPPWSPDKTTPYPASFLDGISHTSPTCNDLSRGFGNQSKNSSPIQSYIKVECVFLILLVCMQKIIYRDSCAFPATISKKTVVVSFPEESRTRKWLDSLEDDQWEVVSYTALTRSVCLKIDTGRTFSNIILVLPVISASLTLSN